MPGLSLKLSLSRAIADAVFGAGNGVRSRTRHVRSPFFGVPCPRGSVEVGGLGDRRRTLTRGRDMPVVPGRATNLRCADGAEGRRARGGVRVG